MSDINPRLGKRIVAAAIMLKDGTVICGVRHLDKLMHQMISAVAASRSDRYTIVTGRRVLEGKIEGFVANDYEFYSREESWIIALGAKQFDPANRTGTMGVLYSEDLW